MRFLAIMTSFAALALPATASAGLPASVKVARCDPLAHTASFDATMRSISGARQLAIKFSLLERFGGGDFKPISAPGLGVWRRSAAGARAFAFAQNVNGLRPGGEYRSRVEFRWMGDGGKALKTARRFSPDCRQTGELPNLQVKTVRLEGKALYAVEVVNVGQGPANAVDVQLAVDEAVQPIKRIASLAPGEARRLRFGGVGCSAELRASVDPMGTVRESAEDDNLRAEACSTMTP
ncbi:MAG: hypothetical protein H0T15_04385 [Thermoleophilaceae bacterium]|nr:hypothetical protein [Thermoleophilaceae bacterium]